MSDAPAPGRPMRIALFVAMLAVWLFIGFIVAFVANAGAAGSSSMSTLAWIVVLAYVALSAPFIWRGAVVAFRYRR